MSGRPFLTMVGTWPWTWAGLHVPERRPEPPRPAPPKPAPRTWKLVDVMAEQLGISRTKARAEIAFGRVLVDGVVVLDADRVVDAASEVEWRSA